MDGEGGVRRAAQTAPPRCGGAGQEEGQQRRVLELEQLALSLREKEREVEGTVREMRRQQAEGHRWAHTHTHTEHTEPLRGRN